ncbi:MAG: hypothetical protein ABIK28_21405 [Planctomycetota bacterium]
MNEVNPIIERIRFHHKEGKEVTYFLPENVLDSKTRKIVIELEDGSTDCIPMQGEFEAIKFLLKQAYAYLEGGFRG